jgi:hypothetical protein
MNKNLFSFPFAGMTKNDFNEAMTGLIDKGLAIRVMLEGKEFFSLTPLGQVVNKHARGDASKRN